NSNIKSAIILAIGNLWLKNYNINQISERVDIKRKSVSEILKKVHVRLKDLCYDKTEQICGPGIVVEVDESKFGKRKYHRRHRVEGVWVLDVVERSPFRRVIFVPIEKRNSVNLILLLRKYIHPQSIIYSDCWKGYYNLKSYFSDHLTVNHSVSFVNPHTGTHTNTIEGTWNGLKQTIPPRYRTKELILPYLIRFMFNRNEKNDLFSKLIKYFF
ncbi:hypothetical protein H311_02071, partial [Anncaliia algerae PRA109]